MLPDFPKIKSKLDYGTYRFLVKNFHQTNLLSLMGKKVYFEGDGFSFQKENDDQENEEDFFKEITSKFEITNEELLDKGPVAYIEGILSAIEEMDEKGEKLVIGKIRETTEQTGNIIRHKGKITPDDILAMCEKMSISFDENGNYELVFLSGDDASFGEALAELRSNPKYIEKYEKLIAEKRKKWDDSENNRKLVD
jgi:hypothetical protein